MHDDSTGKRLNILISSLYIIECSIYRLKAIQKHNLNILLLEISAEMSTQFII